MNSISPLDAYRSEIVEYRSEGFNNAQISRQLFDLYGLDTTEASIRRAFKRWASTELTVPEEVIDGELVNTAKIVWGSGMAQLVEPAAFGDDSEIVVFISDIHIPYQDVKLVQSAIELIREVQPHRVVINGDVLDFFQLSHFNKANKRMSELQWEIDMANEFRKQVREAAPNAVIDENEGNHDNRIISYVENKSPALESLRGIKPAELFKYDELEINWHPGCGFLIRPEFLVKHGTLVREEAGATAKAELQKAGISGISGHVHRLCTYRKAGYVQRQWTEQGCLVRLDPDYVPGGLPNWQQGIVISEFSNITNAFAIHEIGVMDGELAPLHRIFART